MKLIDYLKDHKIDKDNPISDAESVIIDDFIWMIDSNINEYIYKFYHELMYYTMYQDESSYKSIVKNISLMNIYRNKINSLINLWLYKDSPLHDYINLKELEEESFEFYHKYFDGKMDKYYRLYNDDNWLNILKEAIYTEEAKKYFNIGE